MKSKRVLLPFVTAGAIVSREPREVIPTSKPGFSIAYARTSVLSVESPAPRPSTKALYASLYWSNFKRFTFG